MANREIRDYNTFSGDDDEGYLIVGGVEGVEGGKKLLSEIVGSNVPNYPTTAASRDTERYHLKVYNQGGDFQVGWEDETYYDVADKGGLVKGSAGNTISFSIYTGNAYDGYVLTYNGTTDEVVWSNKMAELEQRIAYLEPLNSISNPTVNSFNPNVNGFSPTIKE